MTPRYRYDLTQGSVGGRPLVRYPRKTFTAAKLRRLFSFNVNGDLCWERPPKEHARLAGKIAGGATADDLSGKDYWSIRIAGQKYHRSRIVFCMVTGNWPAHQIDHIDGNSLNDRPENLREATQTQNAWNHKKRRKASPLPMGVRLTGAGRYAARIAVNKTSIALGTFDTVSEASRVYQSARLHYFGVFA